MKLPLTLALTALLVAGCAMEDIAMPEAAEGRVLFNDFCASCHGRDADITTKTAKIAAPDLRQIQSRHGGEFPRTAVLSQIDGFGRGKDSTHRMPEFGVFLNEDLIPVEAGGTLTPTPRPLAALLAYLESVQS